MQLQNYWGTPPSGDAPLFILELFEVKGIFVCLKKRHVEFRFKYSEPTDTGSYYKILKKLKHD